MPERTRPPKIDVQVLGVDLLGREARGRQVDRLLDSGDRITARGEVAAALPRRRAAALRRAARRGRPAGQAVLEAGVGQQVIVIGRERFVGDGIAGVDGRAGEAEAGQLVEDVEVAHREADEPRLGPERIDDRAADRVQVELVNVLLPVEDVVEREPVPGDELAGAGAEQVVVVAEEARLAVVGDVQVEAPLGPQDVVEHLDLAGAALDPDQVARRAEQRVVDDADDRLPLDLHGRCPCCRRCRCGRSTGCSGPRCRSSSSRSG